MGSYSSNTVLWAQRRAGFTQKVSWVLLKKALEGWIGVCQVSRAGEKWGLLQGQHDGGTVWIMGRGEEGAGKSDNPSYENLTDHAKERTSILFHRQGKILCSLGSYEPFCITCYVISYVRLQSTTCFVQGWGPWWYNRILYSSEGSGKGLDLGKEGLFWILGISLTEIWGQRT